MNPTRLSRLAVDGHVHIYGAVEPERLLATAAANFAAEVPDFDIGVLMLTESAGHEAFAALRGALKPTLEDNTLWGEADGRRMLVVAGRQIVTAEGLEVLALGLAGKRADGRPLDTVLGELEGEALAVLPWGAGKWLGRRGRLVREARERREVLLGDNGGRPAFWREPLLEGARALAGSDPLPLPGRERKIGSYGSSLQAHISEERPGADLIAALRTSPLEPFGAPESPMGFLRDQLELRLGRG